MALRLVLHVAASHKRDAGTQGRRDAGTQARRHAGTQDYKRMNITKATKDCPCPAFCIHECGIQDTAPQADTLRTKAPMAAQQHKEGAVTTPAGSLPPSHLVCAVHPLLTEGQEALLHEPSVEPHMKQLGTGGGGEGRDASEDKRRHAHSNDHKGEQPKAADVHETVTSSRGREAPYLVIRGTPVVVEELNKRVAAHKELLP